MVTRNVVTRRAEVRARRRREAAALRERIAAKRWLDEMALGIEEDPRENFPRSPKMGQTYIYKSQRWVWIGAQWVLLGTGYSP